MGRGNSKTPARIIELIQAETNRIGQNSTARAIGLPLYSVHQYLHGKREPTLQSYQKIANYFKEPIVITINPETGEV